MAIAIQNLTKRFGELAAVDSLTLSIENGELFGLVGSDGAGKTTTLRMLTGVMPPTSGDAVVLSQPLHKLAGVQQDIGYMSQRFGLYADLTVAENIRFYADLFGVAGPEFKTRSERLLAFSGMAPFTERLAGRLSGGMKQKLGLCCALIHKPKLLLLDEPTNGVDPVSRRDFWRILNELRGEGVTIVVATAYLDEAGRCDRVGLLHQGRLLACGTPAELTGSGSTTLEELVIREIDTPHPPANLPLEGGGIVSSKSNIRCIKLSPPLPALSLSLSLRERVLLASLPQGEDRRGTREGRGGHGVEDTFPWSISPSVSGTSSPLTTSPSVSPKDRSSASSAPTGPANPPPSACCAAFCHPPAAAGMWPGSTSTASRSGSRKTSAT